jgi:hypothetical protein
MVRWVVTAREVVVGVAAVSLAVGVQKTVQEVVWPEAGVFALTLVIVVRRRFRRCVRGADEFDEAAEDG